MAAASASPFASSSDLPLSFLTTSVRLAGDEVHEKDRKHLRLANILEHPIVVGLQDGNALLLEGLETVQESCAGSFLRLHTVHTKDLIYMDMGESGHYEQQKIQGGAYQRTDGEWRGEG